MWKNIVFILVVIPFCHSCTINSESTYQGKKVSDTVAVRAEDSLKGTVSIKTVTINQPVKLISNTSSSAGMPVSQNSDKFRMRRFDHVTALYHRLAKHTIDMCVEQNVPPAAVLAIISLESGWGNGYIGQITGNILSLGKRKGDRELPALTLPVIKETKEVIFDLKMLSKYDSSEWEMQRRPASLKKDYRPIHLAGTTKNLAYFKYHPDERLQARLACIGDFLNIFISDKSRIAAYRKAKVTMNDIVAKNGKEALFTKETNEVFINAIGGRPNTFNFRETWPKKVVNVINNAGLVDLTSKMYLEGKSFVEVW